MKYARRRSYRRRRPIRRRIAKRRFTRRVMRAFVAGAEKKYIDYQGTTGGITTTGLLIPISGIAQGAGKSERVGNRVRFRYLKLSLTWIGNNVGNPLFVRTSVVRSRGPTLTVGDMPTGSINQPMDIEKVHVYRDYHRTLGGDATNNDNNNLQMSMVIRVFKDMLYDGTVNQPQRPFYLFLWSNDTITPSPFADYNMRLTYCDI